MFPDGSTTLSESTVNVNDPFVALSAMTLTTSAAVGLLAVLLNPNRASTIMEPLLRGNNVKIENKWKTITQLLDWWLSKQLTIKPLKQIINHLINKHIEKWICDDETDRALKRALIV